MYTSNLVMEPTIFLNPNQTFRMCYNDNTDGKAGIASATSGDGITWSRDPGIRIQQSGATGSHVLDDGRLRMFSGAFSIGSFISAGGFAFDPEQGIRQPAGGELDSAASFAPDIMRLSDGRVRMYYTGLAGSELFPGGVTRILSSVSSDGLSFTRETGARIDGVPTGEPDISRPRVLRQPNGTYAMYFANGSILHSAVSSDGLAFTRLGSTGALGTSSSTLFQPDGRKRLFHAYSSAQCGNVMFSSIETKVSWKLTAGPDRGKLAGPNQPVTFTVQVGGSGAKPVRLDANLMMLCGSDRRPPAMISVTPNSGQPPFTATVTLTLEQVGTIFRQDVPLTVIATDGTLTQHFTVSVRSSQ